MVLQIKQSKMKKKKKRSFNFLCKKFIKPNILLCWKISTEAPEPRYPLIIDLWFSESLIINPPCVTLIKYEKLLHTIKRRLIQLMFIDLYMSVYLFNQNRKDSRVGDIAHASNHSSRFSNKVRHNLL